MVDRVSGAEQERLCGLAATGRLAAAVRELSGEEARSLWRAAYELAVPLVWARHTRPLELRRRHWSCARDVAALRPDCADGFGRDLDAVVAALLSYRQPIGNVGGWLVRRMDNAIKDGHRRRRGELGAQQRVRVPAWLTTRLGGDPWLVELARLVLEWVGVPGPAGPFPWPLDAWANERARRTGDWRAACGLEVIDRDLRTVLDEMRAGRPHWYTKFVLEPLAHKTAAAVPLPEGDGADRPVPDGPERYEAGLRELAGVALTAIGAGLTAGDEPARLVATVVRSVFLGAPAAGLELDRDPAHGDDGLAGAIERLLGDPAHRDRFVRDVLDLVQAA
ncbi:MAG TPA: hypothetical protein VFV01_18750 [Spirillospora sp.]|nr:hypothetical protein [Spirillospora sp.]